MENKEISQKCKHNGLIKGEHKITTKLFNNLLGQLSIKQKQICCMMKKKEKKESTLRGNKSAYQPRFKRAHSCRVLRDYTLDTVCMHIHEQGGVFDTI